MFITREAFMMPIEVGSGITAWNVVELMAVSSVLILTVRHQGYDYDNAVLVASDQQLLEMMRSTAGISIRAVHVLFPPKWSPTPDWYVAPVSKIELSPPTPDEPLETAVVTLSNGAKYISFPLQRVDSVTGPLTTLAEFPVRAH